MAFSEVAGAKLENRRELVLSGTRFSTIFDSEDSESDIFTIESLNFLQISKTTLEEIPSRLGNLKALTALTLHSNFLKRIPDSISKLIKLKTLDLSNNEIAELPDLSDLVMLESLNLSSNELISVPNVDTLVQLHIIKMSNNKLKKLPDGICGEELVLLAEIIADNNDIEELPTGLNDLPSLKVVDFSSNRLETMPYDFSSCVKLKQVMLSGNGFNDKKLQRLCKDGKTKIILDHLQKTAKQTTSKQETKDKTGKGKGKKSKKVIEEIDTICDVMKVLRFREGLTIQITNNIVGIRPYIVCCIVRNINLKADDTTYKKFIQAQTKLHDTVCQSRQVATIATHDLAKVKSPLSYDAKPPTKIMVRPLFKVKDVSAESLISKLKQEAEEYRKEKKRNTLSGIHKYLDLLRDKARYACLLDKDGVVISFPPITNSDVTKISADTTEMLLEVTSTISLDTCKGIMQSLLVEMLQLGLGGRRSSSKDTGSSDEDGAAGGDSLMTSSGKCLTIEQVQILDEEGLMKVVYPSRVDLNGDGKWKVIRE